MGASTSQLSFLAGLEVASAPLPCERALVFEIEPRALFARQVGVDVVEYADGFLWRHGFAGRISERRRVVDELGQGLLALFMADPEFAVSASSSGSREESLECAARRILAAANSPA